MVIRTLKRPRMAPVATPPARLVTANQTALAKQIRAKAIAFLETWLTGGMIIAPELHGYSEAGYLLKHIAPGDARLAILASQALRAAMVYELTDGGVPEDGANVLLELLAAFLDEESLSNGPGAEGHTASAGLSASRHAEEG